MFSTVLLLWLASHVMVLQSSPAAPSHSIVLETRSDPGDLEIGGELAGLPAGATRYVRYEDLLGLPQETYTVSDDTNFPPSTQISGVALTSLAKLFGQSAHSDLIVAICYDKYRSNYPSDYLSAHHPILVLKINGQLRDKWPLSEHGGPLGPYLISHPPFKPSFSVLSHKDEAQIPFGVSRLDFRTESVVFGAIAPPGKWEKDSPVWQGYQIARQDCFRCHQMRHEGGELASRSWAILSSWAATEPDEFERYVRDPQAVMPSAHMPKHTEYDEQTMHALTAYFKTFSTSRNSQ